MNYKEHLKRQLAFLERSCIAYDQGYTDEAIRMATVIRVLLHKTHRSTSLLAHLGRENINLLNSFIVYSFNIYIKYKIIIIIN